MRRAIKKSALPCLASCLGVWIVQVCRYPGRWEAGDILLHLFLTFLLTTLVVALFLWLWASIRGRK